MSESRPKVPEPGDALILDDSHITPWSGALWRIHRTRGDHPSPWDELRSAGPLDGMRWDPHRPDRAVEAHGLVPSVSYTATTVHGTFAEVFQNDRAIQLHPDRALSSWLPIRELQLIDLSDSDFGVHNNAAHGSTALTQRWARAIFEQFGARIDGLLHDSTIIGDKVAMLFTRARDAYPAAPAFSRPLDHVDVAGFAADVGHRQRWRLL